MLTVISPAKKLDFDSPAKTSKHTTPEYLDHSKQLIKRMRDFSTFELSGLMHVSSKIAELNVDRYKKWTANFTPENSKQSLLAFRGDVFTGMDADSLNSQDLKFAQTHLRILSGLYGLLRPLDLMKAYRLEMGTRLQTARGNNLYEFWGTIITEGLNRQLSAIKSDTLINLASIEYFKSVKPKQLQAKIITPEFREYKNGQYKMIGIYAKRARGLMSRFIIQKRLTDADAIKDFSEEGYAYNKKLAQGNIWVFTRK